MLYIKPPKDKAENWEQLYAQYLMDKKYAQYLIDKKSKNKKSKN